MKQSKGANPFRILIADDDNDDIQLTKDCFVENKLHVQFEEVSDGQHLIDHLKEKKSAYPYTDLPHLILLDLNMPRKSGLEALSELKDDVVLCKIPTIVFTTSVAPKDIERAYDLGANCYIAKPNTLDEWMEKTRQIGQFWIDVVRLIN